MKEIWITSDTHYNHANILNFVDATTGERIRPEFSNVDEMNECLLDSWNSVVKTGDKVYHLGDVFFGPKEKFQKDWPKFNGSKNLIVGNHDDIKYLSAGGFFKKIYLERSFRDERMIFSHRPMHESGVGHGAPGKGIPFVNVHGHIHTNPTPAGRYINVSVEKTNYTPVHIDELSSWVKTILNKDLYE